MSWRDEYKDMEQAFMVVKDQYAELARAAGFEGDSFFGDPLVKHADILLRIKEQAEKAWMYDDLCK